MLLAEIDAPDRAPLSEVLNRRRFRLISEYHELVRPMEVDGYFEWVTIYLTPDISWDWTRLRNGVLNVSMDHDKRAETSVGVVEWAELEDGVIFGQMAFADSEPGNRAWEQVQDGTLAGISPDILLWLRLGTAPDGQGGMKRVAYPTRGEIVDVSLVANPDDANLYITRMTLHGDFLPAADAPSAGEVPGVTFDAGADLLCAKIQMAFGTGDMSGAISDTSHKGEDMDPAEIEARLDAHEKEMAAMKAKMEGYGNGNGNGQDEEKDAEMRAEMSRQVDEITKEGRELRAEMSRQKEIRTAAKAANRPDLVDDAITEGTPVAEFTMGLLEGKYAAIQMNRGLTRPAAKRHFDYGALCQALVYPADKAFQEKAAFEMQIVREHEHAPSADRHINVPTPRDVPVLALPDRRTWHEHFNPPERVAMAMEQRERAQMAFTTGDMSGAVSNTAMFDFSVPYPMDYAADRLIGMCYYREGLMDNVRYPVTIAGIAPAFVAEGAEGGTGEPKVIEQTLTPHALEKEVEISRRSSIQTGGWSMDETFRVAEIDFRHRILEALLGTVDTAGVVTVAGTPSATVIAGLLNREDPAGVSDAAELAARGAVDQPTGAVWASTAVAPDFDELLELITFLSNKRAPYESRAYVLSPGQVQPYSRTPQYTVDVATANQARAAAAGPMVLEGMAGAERIGRFPAVETTLLPTASPTIVAGVWAAMNIGTWQTPLFWVDALTKTGLVVFHAYHEFDASMARSDYFTKFVRA